MSLICFAPPKGGVGKITLAANIADTLHRGGRHVVTLDFDSQNMLSLHFGVALTNGGGVVADLPKRPDWSNAARQTNSGVILLPHGAIDIWGELGLAAALERDPEWLTAPVLAIFANPHALNLLAPMSAMVVCLLLADAMSAALMPEPFPAPWGAR